ncbi:MAG: ester cyclase [Thermoleophilia bacterium]
MSRTDDNKQAYRRFVEEVFNKGNIDAVDEMVSPDYVDHELFADEIPQNREGLKKGVLMCRDCLAELSVSIQDVSAEGDKIIARTTWHGVQGAANGRGFDAGKPASVRDPRAGEAVEFDTLDIARYEDGMVVEHWGLTDDGPGWPTAYYLPQRAGS